ncbi:Smr/MutS family protein [bacterium]|nr:Smr/MutS family protein [bacterium]
MGRFKKRQPGTSGRSKGMGRSIRHGSEEGEREYRSGEPPPAVQLRRLRGDEALATLAREVVSHRRRGTRELLVVHGKGLGSDGAPVLGDLVRSWLKQHTDEVASWRPAPRDWGGEGALVIVLRKVEG